MIADNGIRGQVFVVCDCQAAISAIEAPITKSACPRLVQEIKLNLQHACILHLVTSFIWVPSHKKKATCRPAGGHDAAFLRHINDCADAHCTEVLTRRLQGSFRQRWHVLADNATRWEYHAIHAAAKGAERLHPRFQRVGAQIRAASDTTVA